jgi:hypothetical protein
MGINSHAAFMGDSIPMSSISIIYKGFFILFASVTPLIYVIIVGFKIKVFSNDEYT